MIELAEAELAEAELAKTELAQWRCHPTLIRTLTAGNECLREVIHESTMEAEVHECLGKLP